MDEALKALAHPHRRAMLQLVLEQPRTAGELATATGLRQPTASQHLKVLRDAQIVEVEARANQRIYHVNFERIAAIRAFLDAFWGSKLDRLKRVAAKKRKGGRSGKGR